MTAVILSLDALPRTIIQARHLGQAHYFTGRPCPRGHVDARNARSGDCLSCAKTRVDKAQTSYTGLSNKRWRDANPERCRQHAKNFRERFPEYQVAYNAERRARLIRATPPWADASEIRSIYRLAKRLEQQDGVKRHVDHVIPLRNPLVCGLHVAENLRVVTAVENLAKSNKYESWEHLCSKLHNSESPTTLAA